MFSVNQIYKIDVLLNKDESEQFERSTIPFDWSFDGFSYDDTRVFWRKDLWETRETKCHYAEELFRVKLESLLEVKLETERLYINGQAHGQCGAMHTDVDVDADGDYITMVYYPPVEWKPEYGGFTLITDSADNLHIVYPKPNSAVVFNSKFGHVGLEPTIHCKTQRITVAQKFKVVK